ncbi:PAF acetylhydrolase family protein [Bisporella sp. PMI_857]|nr:PAF acetylhydrolase family protein [Bisporella sp. PMI_857]
MVPLAFFILALASRAISLSFPPLRGKHLVGTVAFEVIDYSRTDPYAPTPRPRDIMVSAFYPIKHKRRYPLAKPYAPAYASYLDATVGLQPGTAATAVTQAYEGAYLHATSGKVPSVLFFSPGYGMSRQDYAAALSNLASHGYLVLGIDHPYDTAFIVYPDGHNVTGINLLTSPETIILATDTRVKDVQSVLNLLSTNKTIAKNIPGLHGPLKNTPIGVFGHSLGGATAATALFTSPRFRCGVNLDGTILGPVVEAGFSQPFMFAGTPSHNLTSDASWTTLYSKLRGFKLAITVAGAEHSTYSDQAFLYDELRKVGAIPDLGDLFGTIGGARMLEIEDAYLTAFFDRFLRGDKDPLLNGPSGQFPEVLFS